MFNFLSQSYTTSPPPQQWRGHHALLEEALKGYWGKLPTRYKTYLVSMPNGAARLLCVATAPIKDFDFDVMLHSGGYQEILIESPEGIRYLLQDDGWLDEELCCIPREYIPFPRGFIRFLEELATTLTTSQARLAEFTGQVEEVAS
jgi:hypothetical protein